MLSSPRVAKESGLRPSLTPGNLRSAALRLSTERAPTMRRLVGWLGAPRARLGLSTRAASGRDGWGEGSRRGR
eukprot:5557470-Alexandrium_andersonii.AAC.1